VLGPLRVAVYFESRIANPWLLDCGALAGFLQPGTFEVAYIGVLNYKGLSEQGG